MNQESNRYSWQSRSEWAVLFVLPAGLGLLILRLNSFLFFLVLFSLFVAPFSKLLSQLKTLPLSVISASSFRLPKRATFQIQTKAKVCGPAVFSANVVAFSCKFLCRFWLKTRPFILPNVQKWPLLSSSILNPRGCTQRRHGPGNLGRIGLNWPRRLR